jgi:hypothetical protein
MVTYRNKTYIPHSPHSLNNFPNFLHPKRYKVHISKNLDHLGIASVVYMEIKVAEEIDFSQDLSVFVLEIIGKASNEYHFPDMLWTYGIMLQQMGR